MFHIQPDIKNYYKNKFKFILVDEYQDTNMCQYQWLQNIVNKNQNICVVGDDDQSIYSWRGAEVKNIFKFEKEYDKVKVIKLEKNYRSKANILNAANYLISNNKNRMGKDLWTDDKAGEKIEIINVNNNEEERLISVIKLKNFYRQEYYLKVLLYWSELVIKLELLRIDLLKSVCLTRL